MFEENKDSRTDEALENTGAPTNTGTSADTHLREKSEQPGQTRMHGEPETPAQPAAPAPVMVIPEEKPANELPPTWGQIFLLFLVAGVIILADQFTKRLVEQNIPLGTSLVPFDQWAQIFQFTHTTNTGAAFGLFPNGGTLFALAAIVVSIVIVIYNFRLPAGHLLLRVALGLQLGGALGNLIDRTRQGYVTDFIDVGPVPIFNIADAAVVTGVIIMALIIFLESRQEHQADNPTPEAAQPPVVQSETSRSPTTLTPLSTQTDEPGTH